MDEYTADVNPLQKIKTMEATLFFKQITSKRIKNAISQIFHAKVLVFLQNMFNFEVFYSQRNSILKKNLLQSIDRQYFAII